MATVIRANVSERNKYWIDKHRHYELKHFCLQYPEWKKKYLEMDDMCLTAVIWDRMPASNIPGDLTARCAIKRAFYGEKIKLIEEAAMGSDEDLYIYILKGVTEGLSYTNLKSRYGIPCSKDTYYDRYRRFFWLLNKTRN